MRWKGKWLQTLPEWLDALADLLTPRQGRAFRLRALAQGMNDSTLGYMTGYLAWEEGKRVRRLLGCPHPIYGMGGQEPPPGLSLLIGREVARQSEYVP